MAEHTSSGPVETGAEMDYREHEKTYDMFLKLVKWGTIHVIVILILMAMFLL